MTSVFPSLHGYRKAWLPRDLLAGLTVWAVLVPEALAYAAIAGVSPVVGLYAAPAALILYAALGSSRHLVTGPMAATAALSAAAIASVSGSDAATLTVVLAIMTGLVAFAAGLLRLGFIANFISEPVMKGFITGLALTIVAGQLPDLVGVDGGEGNFFRKLWSWVGNLGDADGTTVVLGLGSLALVLGLRRISGLIPGSLIAVALGILAVHLFGLDSKGVEIVGEIDSGLPSLGLPDAELSDYTSLAVAAIGIMLVGFAESLGAARTYAARNHYEIDPNRELLGLGAANLGAGLSSGMVVNGSLSKTAVNGTAGARSEVSGLVVAALVVLTLLFLTGLFADLPDATLAAVVIAALIELVDFRSISVLYRAYTAQLGHIYGFAARPDFIAGVAAMLGVLFFDTLPGLLLGISLSLLLLLYRSSRPNIAELGEVADSPGTYADIHRSNKAKSIDGVTILRVESGLYFANADHIRARVRAAADAPGARAVIIDAESMPFIDVTASRMLVELADDLQRRKVTLAMAHEIGQVRDLMRHGSDAAGVVIYPSVAEAVDAIRENGGTSRPGR